MCCPAAAEVRAADYDAYWLWAGVRARPDVAHARTLYLLVGEVGPGADGANRLKAQGAAQPGPHAAKLWLAFRVRSLDWTPEVRAGVLRKLALWRAQPGEVAGVQIDFDAATHGLARYASFLRDLRAALPRDCGLSVTGLMDWASQGAPEDLSALSGMVDEIIFQTYRGRATVENIDAYLARLGRLTIPYRLGLAEGAQWTAPNGLASAPHFHGYVVFLRNGAP
ncbi:DUF3142 domain-containing protein [Rhodoblastus acidophilus]|nr:DUF3142 domain-containing protein [Rhodoblastus acidophilus]PPQ40122.1 DUF3142 domain-containing protein [Rhodoblastus acidophilus]RAI21127.1 DUF3142 domain-containing protein [Rhodoblastus acidophilus]